MIGFGLFLKIEYKKFNKVVYNKKYYNSKTIIMKKIEIYFIFLLMYI